MKSVSVLGEPSPEISLQSIWILLLRLESTVSKCASYVSSLVQVVAQHASQHQVFVEAMEGRIGELSKEVQASREVIHQLIKGKMIIHQKLEQFENKFRSLNLRIPNFPRILSMSPVEIFKKYLSEVLLIPDCYTSFC